MTRVPRILALTAGTGAGHNRAAQAIVLSGVASDAKWFDCLRLLSPVCRDYFLGFFLLWAKHLARVNTFGFNWLYPPHRRRWQAPLKSLARWTHREVPGFVRRLRPDAAVCTHFMAGELILSAAGLRRPPFPVYTLITDYDVHSCWMTPNLSGFFVGSERARDIVLGYGIRPDRVRITGIPVHPHFFRERDREEIRRRWSVPTGCPCVVLMSGGLGVGPVEQIVRGIQSLTDEMRVFVVAGRNRRLFRRLRRRCGRDPRMAVLGFVEPIDDLLAMADLLVSKPGAMSMTEAAALGVPMVLFSHVYGFEVGNLSHFLQGGAATAASRAEVVTRKVSSLLRSPAERDQMRHQALGLARPHAAREIVEAALAWAREDGYCDADPSQDWGRLPAQPPSLMPELL